MYVLIRPIVICGPCRLQRHTKLILIWFFEMTYITDAIRVSRSSCTYVALTQRINHDDVPYLIKFYVIRWLLAVFREFATDPPPAGAAADADAASGDWRGWGRGRGHTEQFARKHRATCRTRRDIIDEHRQLVAESDAELVQVQTAHQWDVIKKWLITRLPVEQDPDLSFQGHGQTDRWTDRRVQSVMQPLIEWEGRIIVIYVCVPALEQILINICEYYVIFNIRNMRFSFYGTGMSI